MFSTFKNPKTCAEYEFEKKRDYPELLYPIQKFCQIPSDE